MKPDSRELDEEIRGHLAISIKERIDRGEDPEAARLAALREFGYVPQMREEMRRVWYGRWFDAAQALAQEVRVAFRSLLGAKGLAATVVITLALGIGANAAIFSVVRGVLLRPLVNRGEDRLIYIRQSAPGTGNPNTTFSVPEINDLRSRVTSIGAFGEFSTVHFTMVGLGEPRVVRSGVVNGAYFEVMGLQPILGRLLTPADDGAEAASVAVLTHRFWTTSLDSDPSVIGKTIRLDARNATVIGVLEPSVPHPADTEIIANMVASPHHLEATMVTMRTHRMTELFGRLAAGASIESARAELTDVYDAIKREHPDSYSQRANMQLQVTTLRDQIASPARTILIVLLAASALVFIIACSNVANLILARSVRREGELAVRAALGASHGALRRTLLAEGLVLCTAGAALGLLLARPMVSLVAQYAARFSVRALEVTVDSTLLWVGAALAVVSAIVLAYVPQLPSAQTPNGFGLANGSVRITPGTNRRLRVFATAQISVSFVLLAGAAAMLAALIALQTARTGYEMQQVLVFDVPMPRLALSSQREMAFYHEATRRIEELQGVDRVALGSVAPWRDAGSVFQNTMPLAAEGFTAADGGDDPRARIRVVTPGFFDVVGISMRAGRDFTAGDSMGADLVVIVSESVAQRLFPDGDALNRRVWWTDPYFNRDGQAPVRWRIVGVVADVDDTRIEGGPAPTIYHALQQFPMTGRLFVRASGDPYTLVEPVTRIIRELSPTQAVERAATLEDVRAEVLAPDRLNAFVFSGFAGIALLIAVVGVAGVLAFGVSARTREFGVRLAVGSSPWRLLIRVLSEGANIVAIGLVLGVLGGVACAAIGAAYFGSLRLPGIVSLLGAAAVLTGAAILASLIPAARASRVDVLQALRSE